MAETSAFFAKTDCESSLGDAFKLGNPGDSCVRWTMALIFKSIKHLARLKIADTCAEKDLQAGMFACAGQLSLRQFFS